MTTAADNGRDDLKKRCSRRVDRGDRRADGSILLRSSVPLGPAPLRRGLAGALGAANAGQDLSRRAGEP